MTTKKLIKKLAGVKKCTCRVRDPNVFRYSVGSIIGISGILLVILALAVLFFVAIATERDAWVAVDVLCILIVLLLLVFLLNLQQWKRRGHTWHCSLRYAALNLFYSGLIF